MATRKYVWVECCVCHGEGFEMGVIRVKVDGATTWVPHQDECTNCAGDGGHRMPVLAPDPPPIVSTDRPAWWPDDDPAYD